MRLQDLNNAIAARSGGEKKLTTFSCVRCLRLLAKEGPNRKYSRCHRRLLADVALLVCQGAIFRGPAKKKMMHKKCEYCARKRHSCVPVSVPSLFAGLSYNCR